MTSEIKAPECGHPFCGETCGSAAIEAPHTQRGLTQIAEASPGLLTARDAKILRLRQMLEASASVFSRSNEQIDTLRAELAAEKAKVARLGEVLKACVSSLERADTAEGVCCCGDNMESHGDPMNCGHSPVDMGDYYARKALEAARAAIAAYEVKP